MKKRSHIDLEIEEGGLVTSRFFKRPVKRENAVKDRNDEEKTYLSIEKIKSLEPLDYFETINEQTNDDPKLWAIPLDLEDDLEKFPRNFLPIYSRVRKMRSKVKTPVDSIGCPYIPIVVSKACEIPIENLKPINYRLQLLIALMLSSQTKDEIVTKAIMNIMQYCICSMEVKNGITLKSMLDIEEPILQKLIQQTGYYKKKASYIKRTVVILQEKFNSDIPANIEDLLTLPGVGRKMGYLTLQKAWGRIDGICVDVHVDRLCKMWGWVDRNKCKSPEQTRKELEKWLPHNLWYEFNTVLVGFGQMICTAKVRRCDICLANQICNASTVRRNRE